VQHLVPEERYLIVDLATPEVWCMALYRLLLIHQKDRRSCLDVSVRRGVVHNTDRNLVCMKFKLKKPYRRRYKYRIEKRRFDVSQLRSGDDTDATVAVRHQ